MSHPHHEHRDHKVQHRRVAAITRGYAAGGAVHGDEVEDEKLIKKTVKKSALKVEGKHAHQRADRPRRKAGGPVESAKMSTRKAASKEGRREEHDHEEVHELARAKGGRAGKGKGKTVVNVIAGGGMHPGMMPPPGGAPVPPPAAPPGPMVGAPPMPPRPMPPMGAGAPGMPPGMPPRKAGGRAYARGGGVSDGPAWNEGRRTGTQVQHESAKRVVHENMHRGKPVTYKTGGAVEHPVHGGMAPHLPGGAGGGEARLAKQHKAARR